MNLISPQSRRRSRKLIRTWSLRGIPFSLALISILLSVESDVFQQHSSPLQAIWSEPWEAFERHDEIPLSDLLQTTDGRTGSAAPSMGAPGAPEIPPLYVFALDVSGSMKGRRLWEREIEEYEKQVTREEGGPHALACLRASSHRSEPQTNAATFSGDLALAELCRYLGSVPIPSRVSLWTFGKDAQQVVPEHNTSGDKYVEVRQALGGGPPAHIFLTWAQHPDNRTHTQKWTDIENLFNDLYQRYTPEIEGGNDVHIVIISDFIHDVDGKLADSEDSQGNVSTLEWEGYYLSSRNVIGEHVTRMVGKGVTLHLAVIQGGDSSLRNVLPVLRGQAEWGDIREANLGSGGTVAAFDFLRSYEQAGDLRFRFTSGQSKPTPRSLWLDGGDFEGASIRLGLAADPLIEDGEDFRIRVSSERDGPRTKDHYNGTMKANDGEYVREILRAGEDGDRLILQPSTILSPRQAASYRLLVSWDGHGKSEKESACCTYSVPIVFHQDLSRPSAVAILGSYTVLVISLLGCTITWIVPAVVKVLSGAYRQIFSRLQRRSNREVTGN